ncbi:hypothetical protein GI582_11090 [Sulfitobacter sp. BDSS02]|uniref:hypothetical protein n=1 Tax=Heliomarina TaxID=2917553 RepID=UPI001EE21117|nr:hypothetical protein [Heliomarina baculiformis]MBL3703233.1 hypothetical protein [Sulfitobacter sp. BDSS02]MBR9850028.1 hypothetical protein [Paracoccaceae bacterium]
MKVSDRLDALRAATESCSLAAFGDLETRLVLRVSADNQWPQEKLDALCKLAARCFDQADHIAISSDADMALDFSTEAIVLHPDGIKLFVRSDQVPSDMICCVCHSAADLPILTNGARSAMRNI